MRATATGQTPRNRPAAAAAAAAPAAAVLRSLAPAAALGLAAFVAACGSGATRTVSVSTPAGRQASATGPAAARPGAGRRHTAPAQTTGSSTPASPQTTRTATAPAFAQQQPSGEGLDQAVTVVKGHGFEATDTSEYHPAQTLRVLVGTQHGPAGGATQQAFFFVGGRFLGTDTSAPSGQVEVVGQSDTEVTLAYSLYRPHDQPCCATGGQARVRFQLDNGRLAPLDPIPPASSSTGLSRQ